MHKKGIPSGASAIYTLALPTKDTPIAENAENSRVQCYKNGLQAKVQSALIICECWWQNHEKRVCHHTTVNGEYANLRLFVDGLRDRNPVAAFCGDFL